MTKHLKYLTVLILLLQNLTPAQIKVTSLPKNQNGIFDPVFFDKNEVRNVELMNSGWSAFPENNPEKKISISVPAVFDGDDVLIFEKKIGLTNEQIYNSQLVLGFLGINYSSEISVNGYNIYKHSGGSLPFEIPLPKDILKENSVLTIKVSSKLNSDSSIPAKQRFMFSSLKGGIFRDVYIKIVPTLHITYNSYTFSFDQSQTKANLKFKIGIGNSAFNKASSVSQSQEILIRINLFQKNSPVPQAKGDFTSTISEEDNIIEADIELTKPLLWSPLTPDYYFCEISLIKSGQVIDKTVKQISLYQIKKDQNNFLLNGNPFTLQGTTYYIDETLLKRMNSYDKLRDDLKLIKSTGFNSVRFSKSYPNPYAIKLCQELGLFALIELPLNSIPEEILEQADYQLRAISMMKSYINYSEYGNTTIFGLGSSFLPNSEITQNFLERVGHSISTKGFSTYASFVGVQTGTIPEIDFYGIELYSSPPENIRDEVQRGIDSVGKNSFFISEMSYPNYAGNQSGYLAKYSSDAQAKYFKDMIDYSRNISISGFFINSLFDYRGEYASLYGGYSEDMIYKIGVLDNNRNLNSIGYKVLLAKLGNDAKVTIPIGTRKEENSIMFILIALSLTLLMAVLINVKKKFKEDCTRALLRPYNFYADIRDHRIMSGIHTTILMLIHAGSASLLITVLLFYFRSNILMEKLALSFGHHSLMKLISFMSWNPLISFIFFTVIMIFKFALIAAIIKFASFFIKTRVEFLSIFFMVIWSFLPFSVLLPLEAILFKVLTMVAFNSAVFIFLILFFLWILQRILKGIYVVFDVRPAFVYMYSIGVIIIIICGFLLKYHITDSIIYYVSNSIKQYHSMIF
ncbi:MAG: hypothetical protein CVV24_14900 [Ignavibacteriae bacterium HGW-Ignavibacteriae-3]|nr:MAG: hypothetical protein CVV24_14900 [Ignavibacteriae bacterium HGW-Ignavibacteriae-3]